MQLTRGVQAEVSAGQVKEAWLGMCLTFHIQVQLPRMPQLGLQMGLNSCENLKEIIMVHVVK